MLTSQRQIKLTAQNEMRIITPMRVRTFVIFKKLHEYFTCIVQVKNYYFN